MRAYRQVDQLAIDWTRCDGHGLCAALLPGVVALDEWGYPLINQAAVADTHESAMKRAIVACPALALRIVRRPG